MYLLIHIIMNIKKLVEQDISVLFCIVKLVFIDKQAIFFSLSYSLYLILIFAHLWWFGVSGSYIGFLGLGFSVDGVWGLWCGAFWVFWVWCSLYKHKRIILGKNCATSKDATT